MTLFSAPNYCGEFDNAGAVMGVSEDLTCWFSVLPVRVLINTTTSWRLICFCVLSLTKRRYSSSTISNRSKYTSSVFF